MSKDGTMTEITSDELDVMRELVAGSPGWKNKLILEKLIASFDALKAQNDLLEASLIEVRRAIGDGYGTNMLAAINNLKAEIIELKTERDTALNSLRVVTYQRDETRQAFSEEGKMAREEGHQLRLEIIALQSELETKEEILRRTNHNLATAIEKSEACQRDLDAAEAKATELASEREFFIQWLLIAQDTLARDGWEEGWSDEEVRKDLLLILGSLGFSPHSKEGRKLRGRKVRYAP